MGLSLCLKLDKSTIMLYNVPNLSEFLLVTHLNQKPHNYCILCLPCLFSLLEFHNFIAGKGSTPCKIFTCLGHSFFVSITSTFSCCQVSTGACGTATSHQTREQRDPGLSGELGSVYGCS